MNAGSAQPFRQQQVDIGGRRLAVTCGGAGQPTVVLETGLGAPSDWWEPVQQAIAPLTLVCRYDRAGTGGSDPAPTPRTLQDLMHDLRALLQIQSAALPAPYILVGHSIGGMIVRLYAYQFPDDVAGLVLVDPSHPDQFDRLGGLLPKPTPHDSPELRGFRDFWTRGYQDPACNQEVIDFPGSHDQLRAITSLGNLPLTILASGSTVKMLGIAEEYSRPMEQAWWSLNEEIGHLSTRSRQQVVEGSGHFIQRERPDIVSDAIREMIADLRAG